MWRTVNGAHTKQLNFVNKNSESLIILWAVGVETSNSATRKQHPLSIKHHKHHMFDIGNISVSTYVNEINHTNFKVIFY